MALLAPVLLPERPEHQNVILDSLFVLQKYLYLFASSYAQVPEEDTKRGFILEVWALFRCEIFLDFATVAFSFVCLIMN